jgi:hypothetical protein
VSAVTTSSSPGIGALLLRAWALTALIDGLFSSLLSVFAYHSSAERLFQGVASTLLGPAALTGGTRTALIGVLMHLGVALAWSTLFLLLVLKSGALRRILAGPGGALKVALLYGPFVWLVMSLVVVPLLLRRPPNITVRWWIQLAGHAPFVGLPIAASIRRGLAPSGA